MKLINKYYIINLIAFFAVESLALSPERTARGINEKYRSEIEVLIEQKVNSFIQARSLLGAGASRDPVRVMDSLFVARPRILFSDPWFEFFRQDPISAALVLSRESNPRHFGLWDTSVLANMLLDARIRILLFNEIYANVPTYYRDILEQFFQHFRSIISTSEINPELKNALLLPGANRNNCFKGMLFRSYLYLIHELDLGSEQAMKLKSLIIIRAGDVIDEDAQFHAKKWKESDKSLAAWLKHCCIWQPRMLHKLADFANPRFAAWHFSASPISIRTLGRMSLLRIAPMLVLPYISGNSHQEIRGGFNGLANFEHDFFHALGYNNEDLPPDFDDNARLLLNWIIEQERIEGTYNPAYELILFFYFHEENAPYSRLNFIDRLQNSNTNFISLSLFQKQERYAQVTQSDIESACKKILAFISSHWR